MNISNEKTETQTLEKSNHKNYAKENNTSQGAQVGDQIEMKPGLNSQELMDTKDENVRLKTELTKHGYVRRELHNNQRY